MSSPNHDRCVCPDAPPLLLRSDLGPHPVACARCNHDVSPEALALSAELTDALASWRRFHDCFYLLWLDSAEFEGWARDQLATPSSPVNTRGLALRARLDAVRRTYFWWFQDAGAPDHRPATACPNCAAALVEQGLFGRICDGCSILVAP